MKTLLICSTLSLALLMSGCGSSRSHTSNLGTKIADKPPVEITSDNDNALNQNSINSIPKAGNQTFEMVSDSDTISGKLDATDSDGDKLSFKVVNSPAQGELVLNKDGSFTYKSNSSSTQSDTFTYVVSDDVSSCKPKTVTIRKIAKKITKPQAPSNLTLEAVSSCKIRVGWDDNSDNENGFVIRRDGKLVMVTKEDIEKIDFCSGLKPDTTYNITVSAQNSSGESKAISGEIRTPVLLTVPDAPTNLKVVSVSKNMVRLSWSDNANNEDKYNVFMDGKWIKSVGADSKCIVIDDLEAGSAHTFYVEAKNSIGSSDSNVITVNTKDEVKKSDDQPIQTDENTTSTDENTTTSSDDQNSTASSDDTNTTETNTTDNNSTTISDDNTTDDNNTTENKIPKSYDGPFGDIKTLLQKSKDGEIADVTYISLGDSTRADDPHYNNGEVFDLVSTKLDEYGVNSILQAQAGHSARRWNNYDNSGTLAGYTTWEDTVANIPGDGSTTILNISLGINDARYTGSKEKETILFHLDNADQGISKLLAQKPNTHIILTMPNKMVGKEKNDGKNHDLDYKSKEVYDAYIELAKKYPMIDVMDELFGGEKDMSMYRAADEEEYGEGVGIHLSAKGQKEVGDLILKTILPE